MSIVLEEKETLELKVKTKPKLYFAKEVEHAVIPTVKPHDADAGLDLTATETITIKPMSTNLVPVGLRVTCEPGYWYTIKPRSSLAFKHSVTPMPGSVFDAKFTGNMDIKMLNLSDKEYTINKGDRFCQIVLKKVHEAEIIELSVEEQEDLFSDGRGNKCWGSSGK